MRCLTLADELRNQGARVEFLCREEPGNLNQLVQEKGFPVRVVRAEDSMQDAEFCRSALEALSSTVDWLIVDHYELGIEWEQRVRPAARRLMALDDVTGRDHCCDLILDQNAPADSKLYASTDGKALLGPDYVLLSHGFQAKLDQAPERCGEVRRILVFFGAADSSQQTEKAVRTLDRVRADGADVTADIVIGAANAHRGKIQALTDSRSWTQLHVQIDYMTDLINNADLALGAAGGAAWERAALGLPMITVATAENHAVVLPRLAQEGYIEYLGPAAEVSEQLLYSAIARACASPDSLREQSRKLKRLIDGKGAHRTVNQMKALLDIE